MRNDCYTNKQITVVDNGSTDESIPAIRATFPEVNLIEARTNLGFTGGNNLGIACVLNAAADYVFLLNNDTVVERDTIAQLVAGSSAHPEAGLLTPVIHYFDCPEEVWFAGARLDLSRGEAVHDNTEVPRRDAPPRPVPWVSGCAMFIPADVLREMRGFDDRFFLNWEDVDLSLRIRQAGRSLLLVPSARIAHKVSRSFRGVPQSGHYYHVRNQLLILRLHGDPKTNGLRRKIAFQRLKECIASAIRNRTFQLIWPTIHAILDDFLGRYGAASGWLSFQREAPQKCEP